MTKDFTYEKDNRINSELMDILWKSDEPLTSVELLDLTKDYTWNGNYIHVLLRSLQKKGFIEVCGILQYSTQYARQYMPKISKDDYISSMVVQIAELAMNMAIDVTSDKERDKLIGILEEMVENLKEGDDTV